MRKAQLLVLGLLLFSLLAACAPKAAPAPAPQAPAPAPAVPAPVAPAAMPAPGKPAWEIEWEKTVQAAKKDGVVAFATSAGVASRRALSEAIKGKYEIRTESISAVSGTNVSKILAERRAGLYLWDVLLGGSSALIGMFKPASATSPLEPVFVLPDLTDPEIIKKVWYNGKLPWIDQEQHLMGALLFVSQNLAINTNLVKPGEIKSWDDLLNPKWKGKILLMDPMLAGTNSDGSLMPLLYLVKGEDYVRNLAAQEPVLVADDRLAVDWLARGKYPAYMPPRPATLLEFVKAGAPVAAAVTLDGMALTAGGTAVSLIDKAPHPNAAKLFINWYLSKEGQTVLSKAYEGQSARLDVPTDFLPPDELRQPGANYWLKDREEVALKVADYRKKSKDIFGHLIK